MARARASAPWPRNRRRRSLCVASAWLSQLSVPQSRPRHPRVLAALRRDCKLRGDGAHRQSRAVSNQCARTPARRRVAGNHGAKRMVSGRSAAVFSPRLFPKLSTTCWQDRARHTYAHHALDMATALSASHARRLLFDRVAPLPGRPAHALHRADTCAAHAGVLPPQGTCRDLGRGTEILAHCRLGRRTAGPSPGRVGAKGAMIFRLHKSECFCHDNRLNTFCADFRRTSTSGCDRG